MTKKWFFAPGIFVFISALLYGNSLPGEFVYDDQFFSVRGDMRMVSYLWQTWFEPSLSQMMDFAHYRPMSFFTFSLNFLLLGESPVWFHAVNILLHGLTCWLLFLVVLRLFGNRSLAWFTALLFAFLPIHTEAVAFIKSRDEILVALFGLSAWLAFLRATDNSKSYRAAWSLLAALCSLAAFLSKESALVLPGVFGGALLFQHGWKRLRKSWLPLLLQACAIGAFFVLHGYAVGWKTIPDSEFLHFGQNPLGYEPPLFALWTGFELFFIAVAKTFVPWNLSAVYGYHHVPVIDTPWGSWMAPAGVLTAVLLLLFLAWPRSRHTPMGVGILTFVVLYFPFSKIPIVKGIDLFAEHWLYAPSIGLCMAAAFLFFLLYSRQRIIAISIGMTILAVYAAILIPRNLVWRNDIALGISMVHDAPDAVQSYAYYAKVNVDYGRQQEAIDLVTDGLKITRLHAPLHHVAAVIALGEGRLDIAEQAVNAAAELHPDITTDLLRATILAKRGAFQESLDLLRTGPWYSDTDHRMRVLLALDLWRLGRREEAEAYFDWDAYLPEKMTREEKVHMIETY